MRNSTRRAQERHDAFVAGFQAALLTLNGVAVVEGGNQVPSSEIVERVYREPETYAEASWAGYTSEPLR